MNDYGYGLWALVVFNSLLFIVFAASFFHPKTKRDWRALGGFSAFVIALFTEMYGYPLTVYVFIVGGFWLIAAAWKVLYAAQRTGRLATEGAYARVRHPQYLGFILIMVGFLLQWPTFATLAMFPVLLFVYRRLAMREEREVRAEFGALYDDYAKRTPRFRPRFHQAVSTTSGNILRS